MAKKAAPKKRIIKGRDYNEDKKQDGLRSARGFGWRKAGTSRKPTKKEIQEHYNGVKNSVYMENRPERGDTRGRAKKGERFEKGGSIDSSMKFHLNDYNRLLDADEYDSVKNGNVWEIRDIETSKVYGKYNKEKGTLVIVGKKDLSNPLVVWLKENSYMSSNNIDKLAKGGKIDRTKSTKKTRVNRTKKAIAQDKNIKALHGGKRISAEGNVYYERRENRQDSNRTTKLEKGGEIKLCSVRKDIVEKGDKVPLEDGKYVSKGNFEYRWTGDDDDVFQIKNKGKWIGAESIDFEFDNKLEKGGDVSTKKWLKEVNDKRLSELKSERGKIEKEYSDDYVEVGGSGRNKAQILADFDEAILERENKQYVNGGEIKGRGWGDFKKGKRISDSAKNLKVGSLYLKHSPQFNSENIVLITKEDTTGLNRDIVYGSFVRPNDLKGKEENFAIWGHDLNSDEYYEIDGMEYEKGGHIGFDKLANKVAKEYEGDKVKPEYQDEYGKTYDKEEAKEVGQKVAAKVYREQQGMMEQGGEIKSTLTLSEIESKLGKTFGFWSVPYEVSVDGHSYRKIMYSNNYKKI